jgi:ABC-2 type transport system permease protein
VSRWSAEWLLLRRDRAAWLLHAFFALACGLAVADSVSAFVREEALQRTRAAEEAERVSQLQEAIATPSPKPVAAWIDPTNPGPVGRGRAATWAFLPLSDLDVVQSQARSVSAVSVTAGGGALDRASRDLTQPRVENLGRFNLGFLLIVVLPLVILLLTFDLVARDHESGVARLLFAQEPSPWSRYTVRAALRTAPAVALSIASATLAVSLSGRFSAPGLALVCVLVVLTAGFWTSVALLIQSWLRTTSSSAILCLTAWTFCVVLLPTLLSIFSQAASPIPSRIERTSASREAQRKASIEVEGLTSQYLGDHPELSGAQVDTSNYYVRKVAIDAAIAAARAPVEQQFFEALDHRRALTVRAAIASPTSLVALTLDELAGTGDARTGLFRRQVEAFQARFATFFSDKTLRGERLTVQAVGERPTFSFDEPPHVWWPLTAFAVWTLVLLALALRRMGSAVSLDRAPRKARLAALT